MAYQGHRSRPAWNVALWIGNDEGLYNLARECIRRERTRDKAAGAMLAILNECGTTETPDGFRYTVTTIRAAMEGL